MDNTIKHNGKLDDILEYSMLYDFYGELLKEKNVKVFVDYVFNDMSLSEIAQEQKMTRQGVRDTVIRCKERLADYEKKLGLVKSFNEIKNSISDIKKETEHIKEYLDTKFETYNRNSEDSGIKNELDSYFKRIDNLMADIADKL